MRSIGLPLWIERLLGRLPRPVPPHVFAVRRRELRLAAFLRPVSTGTGAGFGLELAEFHALALAEGLFGSGPLGVPVGESEALAETVRLLIARAATPVREASVILPDAWTRSMVIELGELPEEPAARLEMLRFRVKRMVPYRVEDLHIEAVPLAPLAAPDPPSHCFVTMANAALCSMIEEGFSKSGVRIGQMSGATLSTIQALHRSARAGGLFGLALVDSDGFCLALVRSGEPVVWRQKSFTEGLSDVDRSRMLIAELRLTRTLLSERFPGEALEALYLAAPRAVEPFWLQVLGQGLECQPVRLGREHLELVGEGFGDAFAELAPLAGAASREVA